MSKFLSSYKHLIKSYDRRKLTEWKVSWLEKPKRVESIKFRLIYFLCFLYVYLPNATLLLKLSSNICCCFIANQLIYSAMWLSLLLFFWHFSLFSSRWQLSVSCANFKRASEWESLNSFGEFYIDQTNQCEKLNSGNNLWIN